MNFEFRISDFGLGFFNPQSTIRNPPFPEPRRILVIRLDRLGDVVLSLPVVQVLRKRYPEAFIAMMVRSAWRDIVEGHPSLNAAILYDKEGAHRTIRQTIRFAHQLRRFQLDTALILHPTYRSHWIAWFAGIPVRIGYNRKGGYLLTHRLPHRKQEGNQHEARFSLEMLQPLGIVERDIPLPQIPVHTQAQHQIATLLADAGISPTDTLIAIHPSASCPSKRWNPERFAQVSDRLVAAHQVKVCLVAGATEAYAAALVEKSMRSVVLNLAGRLSLSQLAALLHRCQLLLSNDSGPIHVAAALGVPVVDIFGRNQRGLSPKRWGPLGEGHTILHKDVGCVTCLAHNCDINFLCLSSLSVEEVYHAATSVLRRQIPFPRITDPSDVST